MHVHSILITATNTQLLCFNCNVREEEPFALYIVNHTMFLAHRSTLSPTLPGFILFEAYLSIILTICVLNLQIFNYEACSLSVAILSMCLHSISSSDKKSEEKVWLSGYVANSLAMLIHTSDFPLPLVILISIVLKQAMHETTENSIDMTMAKPLPSEGSPIRSLWLMCVVFGQHVASANPSLFKHWIWEWLGQGADADTALEKYFELPCTTTPNIDEPDLEGVYNTLDELFHYLKLPAEPSNVECAMSSLLLKSTQDKAVEFMVTISSKHPNWLMNEGIALAFQQVMKGHCMVEGLKEYVVGVINGGEDLNMASSFFPLLRAALWSQELHDNKPAVHWLQTKLNQLPISWQLPAVSFIVCCLSK